jgi:hypothetical protein
MNANAPLIIIPSQVAGWISGVFQVEISDDQMVKVVYEDRSQISARLGPLSHAVQADFLGLVRRVQDVSRATGQRLDSGRLT